MSRGFFSRWHTLFRSERFVLSLVLVGATLAALVVVFGGFLPSGERLAGLFYVLAFVLPAIGALFALGALWWLRSATRVTVPRLLRGKPPEVAVTETTTTADRDTTRLFENSVRRHYQCRDDPSVAELRHRLTEAATRRLRTVRGLEHRAAVEAVEAGTWTDDPVARAFLSPDESLPPAHRLYAAIDPGRAYERRVRRTIDAIDAIDQTAVIR